MCLYNFCLAICNAYKFFEATQNAYKYDILFYTKSTLMMSTRNNKVHVHYCNVTKFGKKPTYIWIDDNK